MKNIIKKFYFNNQNRTAIITNRINKNKLFDVNVGDVVKDENNKTYQVVSLSPATMKEISDNIQTFYVNGNFKGNKLIF